MAHVVADAVGGPAQRQFRQVAGAQDKAAVLVGLLSTLTACTGHVQNTKNNCSYDYLLHPAISISKIIGGCGPAAQQ